MYKYMMGRNEQEGARLFSVVPTDKTGGNGHKLKHMKFCLNMRRQFFYYVVKHWNRFPRDVVESLSVEVLKS